MSSNDAHERISMNGVQGIDDVKLRDVSELWFISAPGDPTCQQTWDTLNKTTSKVSGLTTNFKLHIPDLKVGTLDQLVGLSEDLSKTDGFIESVVRKAAQYLGDVLNEERDKVKENLLVNGMTLAHYITHFQWDMAKYPVKQSLRNLSDILTKQVTQIDTDLKSKSQAYNAVRGNLQNLERKATGSLLTRSLNDIVKKEDVVDNSDYLVTLFVVVPVVNLKEWWAKYEQLSDMVVPRSSKIITQDAENVLLTVTVFHKVIEEYKLHCRENKFIIRDFLYNEKEIEATRTELTKLTTDKKNQFGPLVRWLKVNFAETFIAWMHVKVLRVFVESVLRYGLPVNFQAMVLAPPRKMQKRLREVLNQLYAKLDVTASNKSSKSDVVDMPGVTISGSEYYSYVSFKITIDMVD